MAEFTIDQIARSSLNRLSKWMKITGVTLSMAAMLVSCDKGGGPPEPDPDPAPGNVTAVAEAPASLYEGQSGEWSASCDAEDGLARMKIFYDAPNGSFEKELSVSGTSKDTTFTTSHTAQGNASLQVRCEGDYEFGVNPIDFDDDNVNVDRNPYATTSISIEDFFDGSVVNGSLTFPGSKTFTTTNGVVSINQEDRISRDSLEQGLYRIVFETENEYVNHSSKLKMENYEIESLRILPQERGDWNHQDYLNHLIRESENVLASERWENGIELDVFLYDSSAFVADASVPGARAQETTSTDSLADKHFIDDAETVYNMLNDMIPGLTINVYRESCDTDVEFPKSTLENYENHRYITVGGRPNAPFAISQGKSRDGRKVLNASMHQQTDPRAAVNLFGVLADALQTLGPNNQGRENDTVSPYSEYTGLVQPMLDVLYSRPIASGKYSGLSLPGKDGVVDTVYDYVPDNE